MVPVIFVAWWILYDAKVRRRSLAFSLVSDVNEYIHRNPQIASPIDWQAFAEWSHANNTREWNAADLRPRFVVSSNNPQAPRKWKIDVLEDEIKRLFAIMGG